MAASTYVRKAVIRDFNSVIHAENSPCSERTAARAAAAVPASIRSAIASACAMSILPFRKARSLNSPGRAMRQPSSSRHCNTISTMSAPPWPCSSKTCSPVYEAGAGKYRASPSSTLLPCASRKLENRAWRGAGRLPRMPVAICGTRGPDTRMTPTAPRPAGLAMAAMVSGEPTAALRPRLGGLGFDHLIDAPLLRDGQQRIGQPVKDQAAREPRHHARHDQRHELHDFRLHRIRRRGVQLELGKHRGTHQQGQHEERVARGKIVDPQQEWRLAHFHALEQYPVEGDEKGNLNQHGQATGKRIYFFLLVEFHHGAAQFFA